MLHHELVRIHPFANGNGRHGRETTDQPVKELGRPPVYLGSVNLDFAGTARSTYIGALRLADTGAFECGRNLPTRWQPEDRSRSTPGRLRGAAKAPGSVDAGTIRPFFCIWPYHESKGPTPSIPSPSGRSSPWVLAHVEGLWQRTESKSIEAVCRRRTVHQIESTR